MRKGFHARTSTRLLLTLVTAAPALALTTPAQATETATTYSYVDLGVLGTNRYGVAISVGVGLNNARQAVGHSTTTGPARHGYLWSNGMLRDLAPIDPDPFAGSSANGINDAGDVVGHTSVTSTEPSHAFVYRNGTMTDLGTGHGPGSVSSANDINTAGQVVGYRAATVTAPDRATLWENGTLRDLGALDPGTPDAADRESVAHAVNERGQVVGSAMPASGAPPHGFLWENGAMRDLGTLGGNGEATQAHDINDLGQVVGVSPTAQERLHAFLWDQGTMRDLGALGGKQNSSHAYGVNDSGQVVGLSGLTSTTPARAFLWEQGRMTDLNTRVTGLPADVLLSSARAISDDGTILGTTCDFNCPADKRAPARAYLLVPHS
ncbi:hypothetical protein [Streptomyces sp. NPDC057877]|uniref:hypothetical protein n=1 Tax=Streptomyces sp. NPDC057877 TaxID=3346269 RepID=UPI00368681F6